MQVQYCFLTPLEQLELIQTFLDAGKISIDLRKKGLTKEIKSEHKLVQTIDGRKAIYSSPGHIVGIANYPSNQNELIEFLSSHQTKKEFSYTLLYLVQMEFQQLIFIMILFLVLKTKDMIYQS